MRETIETLLTTYECGRISRRALVQALAAICTFGTRADSSEPQFEAIGINHVTFFVSDPKRSRNFYQNLLGVQVGEEKLSGSILKLRRGFLVARQDASGKLGVDHFSISVRNFNVEGAAAKLKQYGLDPVLMRGTELYFRDPDGMKVQISSDGYAGQLP